MNPPELTYEPCTAKAKQTGNRCRRRPSPGASVCTIHGSGAPQVQRKAAARLALAEALAKGDRRPSWEVLADAAHSLDVVARQLRDQIVAGRRVDARTVDQFIEATERQARLAKVVLDAGIDERRLRLAQEVGGMIAKVIVGVLGDLGVSPTEQVMTLVSQHMDVVGRSLGQGRKVIEGSSR